MEPCEVPGCKLPGQRHHIVFRSQGGLDIPMNFKYLCPEHHTGKESPHGSRAIDLKYKKEEQDKLFKIFTEDTYTIKQIADLIGYDKRRLEKRFAKVRSKAGSYEREDIIRALMGGYIEFIRIGSSHAGRIYTKPSDRAGDITTNRRDNDGRICRAGSSNIGSYKTRVQFRGVFNYTAKST